MKPTVSSAIAAFGAKAKEKLSNPAATGQPEDQLRAPFEQLLGELSEISNLGKAAVAAVGESSVSDLKTRPDYAVTVHNALVGFVELKAPGKGADPRKFKDPHDKLQWQKLSSLPNIIYTDGNAFSLWQNGELVGSVVTLIGDIESSGNKLQAPTGFMSIFESFLSWEPVPPRSAKDLAHTTARLCRLLRDEVTEQLALKSEALTSLAADWRKLLFPEATDERFADGYAQAVTFGMLMARAKKIKLSTGLQQVAAELSHTSSLIGAALRLLTDNAENQETLKTSLGTLTRVLDAVDWAKISKERPDAWLYFYEDFLEVYDNELRKQTGSYYTPPEVVSAMVGLVDEALRTSRYGLHAGLAAPSVTLADPATGTGTFMLGILRKIADNVKADEGEGSVAGAINSAVKRLIAFEMQLGPFAVAQLRILAEIVDLTGSAPKDPIRMFVTNTLGNPDDDEGWIPGILAPIAKSRKEANKIKREEQITVVIGNPPYKVKSMGLGGWIEGESKKAEKSAPLADWMPPAEWAAGLHSKHLRNLYIYFWRWATWKIYDHGPGSKTGIVCYITAAGFLSGLGFQKMRDYLRRTCDDIWVIDCSPEGHQPGVNTRIFQGVQQPVCIVIASRSAKNKIDIPATVHFQALPSVPREDKFTALGAIKLAGKEWIECPSEWRAPFLPASQGAWATFPLLENLFVYNGSGVMPGRTWIIAPDVESLERRWQKLIQAGEGEKEVFFHPHLRNGKPGDKHSKRVVPNSLPGYELRPLSIADEHGPSIQPTPYGFRSFDRQWIIPDNRLINQPNRELWEIRSDQQIYLTAFTEESPTNGPAITFTNLIPDLHHYKGSFGGRVFPLWKNASASEANIPPNLLAFLTAKYGHPVAPADLLAYIAAVTANPAYTVRFQDDLSTPGLRIPITSEWNIFAEAAEVGRTVLWLHTSGERMVDPEKGRPAQPPRMAAGKNPQIPAAGAISQEPAHMPDSINYDAAQRRLLVGTGYVENVDPGMWNYEVSGKQILLQWFSYRKADRERPIIGDRRPPSPLGDIQPNHWLAEYTTDLINLLNVLGCLTALEPTQAELLDAICLGPMISDDELRNGGALEVPVKIKAGKKAPGGPSLFDHAGID
jgi:Type ISP C-terminal specificity domain/N-6 DNA Methylase